MSQAPTTAFRNTSFSLASARQNLLGHSFNNWNPGYSDSNSYICSPDNNWLLLARWGWRTLKRTRELSRAVQICQRSRQQTEETEKQVMIIRISGGLPGIVNWWLLNLIDQWRTPQDRLLNVFIPSWQRQCSLRRLQFCGKHYSVIPIKWTRARNTVAMLRVPKIPTSKNPFPRDSQLHGLLAAEGNMW